MQVGTDWQYALFTQYDNKKVEYPIPITVSQLLDNKHAIAPFNRDVGMTYKAKSDRLYQMMTSQPVQNMIRKRIKYRTRGIAGQSRPEFFLFDGCHRMTLLREFFQGECYVKLFNATDNCEYYAWASQEALDKADHTSLGYYPEYAVVLADEFVSRLKECPISMIELSKELTDAEAYERARVANECKPLQNAHLIKCMCGYQTPMASLLTDLSVISDPLLRFLNDDIYTCNASILCIVDKTDTMDKDFSKTIVKTKNLKNIDYLIQSVSFPDDLKAKLKTAKDETEAKLNDVISTMANTGNTLRSNDNSHRAAIGMLYLALFFAIINYNETTGAPGEMTDQYIQNDKVVKMLKDYIDLPRHERGDNHKRLYVYFVTGKFPGKRAAT